MKELVIDAKVENLDTVIQFLDEQVTEAGCPMKEQMQLDIAVEELFVNIAHYAYAPGEGEAIIRVDADKTRGDVRVEFNDGGIPYNPLEKEDPDVTLPVEEREIGGLGIYMVKMSMDDMFYEYRDGRNILTIVKKY